jgi:hypothetical protein
MEEDYVFETCNPKSLDLIIATIAAILMPIAAEFLFNLSGALIPMAMYYGLFATLSSDGEKVVSIMN